MNKARWEICQCWSIERTVYLDTLLVPPFFTSLTPFDFDVPLFLSFSLSLSLSLSLSFCQAANKFHGSIHLIDFTSYPIYVGKLSFFPSVPSVLLSSVFLPIVHLTLAPMPPLYRSFSFFLLLKIIFVYGFKSSPFYFQIKFTVAPELIYIEKREREREREREKYPYVRIVICLWIAAASRSPTL